MSFLKSRREALGKLLGTAALLSTSGIVSAEDVEGSRKLIKFLKEVPSKIKEGGKKAVEHMSETADGGFDKDSLKVFTALLQGFDDCLKYKVSGICFKKVLGVPIPVAFKVTHYLPTAMIELVKSPGDSIFLNIPASAGMALGSGRSVGAAGMGVHHHAFDARVWRINDQLRAYLTLGISECAMCGDSAVGASGSSDLSSLTELEGIDKVSTEELLSEETVTTSYFHAGGPRISTRTEKKPKYDLSPELRKTLGKLDKASKVAACGLDPFSFSSGVVELFKGKIPADLPLIYTSEIDLGQWRKGCRDMTKNLAVAPVSMYECGLKGMVDDIAATEAIQRSLAKVDLDGKEMPSLAEALGMDDPCVGNLGPLLPRTGKAHGLGEIGASILTAYRAMHVAKHDLETYGGSVTPADRLQPVYPKIVDCLPIDKQSANGQWAYDGVFKPSPRGRYGFIWWTRAECCYAFDVVPRCLALILGAPGQASELNLDGFK